MESRNVTYPLCEIIECRRLARAKIGGLCSLHYNRGRRRDGDIGSAGLEQNRVHPWVFAAVFRAAQGIVEECIPWPGTVDFRGYGLHRKNGRQFRAHRWIYEQVVEPIPLDENGQPLGLDHICHNTDLKCEGGNACLHRRCVNPRHLEPASQKLNNLRGRGFAATRAAQKFCLRGHSLLDSNNVYVSTRGQRVCRECKRIRDRRSYHQKASGLLSR